MSFRKNHCFFEIFLTTTHLAVETAPALIRMLVLPCDRIVHYIFPFEVEIKLGFHLKTYLSDKGCSQLFPLAGTCGRVFIMRFLFVHLGRRKKLENSVKKIKLRSFFLSYVVKNVSKER